MMKPILTNIKPALSAFYMNTHFILYSRYYLLKTRYHSPTSLSFFAPNKYKLVDFFDSIPYQHNIQIKGTKYKIIARKKTLTNIKKKLHTCV